MSASDNASNMAAPATEEEGTQGDTPTPTHQVSSGRRRSLLATLGQPASGRSSFLTALSFEDLYKKWKEDKSSCTPGEMLDLLTWSIHFEDNPNTPDRPANMKATQTALQRRLGDWASGFHNFYRDPERILEGLGRYQILTGSAVSELKQAVRPKEIVVERIVEVPVEKIVEVPKEIYIEKIVEVQKGSTTGLSQTTQHPPEAVTYLPQQGSPSNDPPDEEEFETAAWSMEEWKGMQLLATGSPEASVPTKHDEDKSQVIVMREEVERRSRVLTMEGNSPHKSSSSSSSSRGRLKSERVPSVAESMTVSALEKARPLEDYKRYVMRTSAASTSTKVAGFYETWDNMASQVKDVLNDSWLPKHRVADRQRLIKDIIDNIPSFGTLSKCSSRKGTTVSMIELTMGLLMAWPAEEFPLMRLRGNEAVRLAEKLLGGHPALTGIIPLLRGRVSLIAALAEMARRHDQNYHAFVSDVRIYGQGATETLSNYILRCVQLLFGLDFIFDIKYPPGAILRMLISGLWGHQDKDYMERQEIQLGYDLEAIYRHLSLVASKGFCRVYQTERKPTTSQVGGVAPGPRNKQRIGCKHCDYKLKHEPRRCPEIKCLTCGLKGHISSNCPGNRETNAVFGDHDTGYFAEFRVNDLPVSGQIDLGAYRTIVDHKIAEQLGLETTPEYCDYNGRTELRISKKRLCVDFEGRHYDIQLAFKVGQATNLIGRDLISLDGDRLVPRGSQRHYSRCNKVPAVAGVREASEEHEELKQFITTLKRIPGELSKAPKHKVPLKEVTKPVTCKVTFRNPQKAAIIRAKIAARVQEGSLKKVSTVQWLHPTLLVRKVEPATQPEHFRMVHALQRVNDNTELLTTVYCQGEAITKDLLGMKVFSKIDLKNYFDQLPLHEDSWTLFGFAGPDGELYVVTSVPQGYKNATAVGQAFLRRVLEEANLDRYEATGKNSIDDILLASKTISGLLKATKEVLRLLVAEYNLEVNYSKSQFFVKEVTHFGMILNEKGYRMPSDVANVLDTLRPPESVEEVRSFLAWAEQWSVYCPRIQDHLAGISDLLKKSEQFEMTQERIEAFYKLLEMIRSGEVLKYPDFSSPFWIYLDFSGKAFHFFLQQAHGAIRYDGRKTRGRECSWSSTRGEAKALDMALDKYEPYIFEAETIVFTDAKNLLSLQGTRQVLDHHLERLRQKVARFPRMTIKHLPGKTNPADFPSRCVVLDEEREVHRTRKYLFESEDDTPEDSSSDVEVLLSEEEEEIEVLISEEEEIEVQSSEKAPEEDSEEKGELKEPSMRHTDSLDPWISTRTDWELDKGALFYRKEGIKCPKPEDRIGLLARYHHLSGHQPGVAGLLSTVKLRYWWPLLRRDATAVIKSCEVCRLLKARKLKTGQEPWKEPSTKLERLHLDHFHYKKQLFLLIADALTLFVWVREVEEMTTEETMKHLMKVFFDFGYPATVVADSGPGLTKAMDARLKALGVERIATIPEKPMSNGLVERAIGLVKMAAKKILACYPAMTVGLALAKAAESHNQSPSYDFSHSPYDLMFGMMPRRVTRAGDEWILRHQEVKEAVRMKKLREVKPQEKPLIGAEVVVLSPEGKITLDPYPVIFTVLKRDKHTCLVTDGHMELRVPYGKLRLLPSRQ